MECIAQSHNSFLFYYRSPKCLPGLRNYHFFKAQTSESNRQQWHELGSDLKTTRKPGVGSHFTFTSPPTVVSLFPLCRLVLPYERHRRGEEDKPLPPSKPRKQYKRSEEGKCKREGDGKKRRRPDGDDPEVKWNTCRTAELTSFLKSAKKKEKIWFQYQNIFPVIVRFYNNNRHLIPLLLKRYARCAQIRATLRNTTGRQLRSSTLRLTSDFRQTSFVLRLGDVIRFSGQPGNFHTVHFHITACSRARGKKSVPRGFSGWVRVL